MYKVITHSGGFHADEVFAVATLQLHYGVENVEIIRTRDESVITEGDIVVDVGGIYDPEQGRFDHHQIGAPIRENEIPYAAFGLVWKEWGEAVAGSSEVAARLEDRLVLPIDAGDNGVTLFDVNERGIPPITIQYVLSLLKPEWGSEDNIDEAFLKACAVARTVIERAVAHATAELKEEAVAIAAYEAAPDKRLVISDQPISAHFFIDYPEPLFVICPDDPKSNDNWTVSAVRVRKDSFESRLQFPESWGGLRDKELAEVSGIADAIFCHKARFLFVAGSKEGALEAARKALGE